jgi:hypothetical protein
VLPLAPLADAVAVEPLEDVAVPATVALVATSAVVAAPEDAAAKEVLPVKVLIAVEAFETTVANNRG